MLNEIGRRGLDRSTPVHCGEIYEDPNGSTSPHCHNLTVMDTQFENAYVTIPISCEIRVPSSVFVALAKHIEIECIARVQRHRAPTKMFETESGFQRLAFTIKETAEILGVSTPTVYRLISRQLLKSSKALRHKLIPRSEIERFLRETTALQP